MFGLFGWSLSIIADSERQFSIAAFKAQQIMNERAKHFERENTDQIAMDTVEGRSKPPFVVLHNL